MRRLGSQLALAFASVALGTALLAMVILGALWQRQFEGYVLTGLNDRAAGLAVAMARSYADAGGWDQVAFDELSHLGMMNGLRVQVLDSSGRLLVDNSSDMRAMMGDITGGQIPGLTGQPKGPVASARVVVDGQVVGSVRIASVTGELLSERDRQFRTGSLGGLIAAGLVAALLATVSGVLYSRLLTRPINAITSTAAGRRDGRHDARTRMDGDDELSLLGRTFDEMADAIEADRNLERRLTADVAHELRTPLMAIQATVEAMLDGVLPTDPERLTVVRDETTRLARLADSLLDLSRMERGEIAFSHVRLEPADPVMVALEAHRALVEASGLALIEDVQRGLRVVGDPDRLTQAVGNLLSNAIRYTPEGGTVTVEVAAKAGHAVISVADTGVGIELADQDKVFRRFWRADSSREGTGVGIGLALVKEIVDRHGGTIRVESSPGRGTRFDISLPLG